MAGAPRRARLETLANVEEAAETLRRRRNEEPATHDAVIASEAKQFSRLARRGTWIASSLRSSQ